MKQQLAGLARPCTRPVRPAGKRRVASLALNASARPLRWQQQQQEQQQEQEEQQQQQEQRRDEGADVQPAGGKPSLVRRTRDYEYAVELPGGERLVVSALRPEWMAECADLLASSFIVAANILPYGRFVRRRITSYLEEHIKLPPKAVVVTAVLERPDGGYTSDGPGAGGAAGSSGGSAGNGPLGSYGSLGAGSSAGGGGGGSYDDGGSLASGANDAAGGRSSVGSARGGPLDAIDSSSDGGGGGGGGAAGSSSGARGGGARVLVGTAEVSFDASTRSSYLTLNPPAECGYICNTAVAPEWRRRGVATHLMRALEDIAAMAGQRYTYLHLRFKDDSGAGALYRGLGYQEFQKDGLWLLLLGQDRRWLMRKRLDAARD